MLDLTEVTTFRKLKKAAKSQPFLLALFALADVAYHYFSLGK